MNRVRRIAVVAACATLVLAACASTSTDDPEAAEAPPGLEEYYSQKLDWTGCADDPAFSTGVEQMDVTFDLESLECAWLTVPTDYDDPAGETIRLAVARSVAEDSQGSVVINPGGPGGSGVNITSTVVDRAGDTLRDSLDVVGFDPRGVGRSAPVDCLDDADLDTFLATDIDTTTDEGVVQLQEANAAFAQACDERTGALLGHVDTTSAARDMDVLRAALGETTLTYLGISYGTELGATYAELFPEQVGRMVLDGAVDPTITPGEKTVVQAGGFESALRAYVQDCLDGRGCPLSGSVDDALAQIVDLVEETATQPMSTTGGRLLTRPLAITGIMAALYSQQTWFILDLALESAIDEQDGTWLLLLADSYYERCDGITCPAEDGYYGNLFEANVAISCADDRRDTDPATMAAEAEQIRQVAPTVAPFFEVEVDSCASWSTPATGPLSSYAAEGAPPIVVVGTTNDPATPYEWAQSLAKILDSGVLVTYEGEGHGAYLGGTECVQTAVDDYLVKDKVPEDGLTCPAS